MQAQDYLEAAAEALRFGQPQAALRLARHAARLTTDPVVRAFNLAGFLIDAGSDLHNTRLIREGVGLLDGLLQSAPSRLQPGLHYNLGNGYASLGTREGGHSPGSRPSLALAVSHLDKTLTLRDQPNARTNLAGVLIQQGRYLEAIDELNRVLASHPEHHTALARRGSAFMGLFNWTNSHEGLLQAALSDHLAAVALSADQPVFRASYERAVGDLRRRVQPVDLPEQAHRTPDQAWILDHYLGLNPCPICALETPAAFDLYPFTGRLEAPRRRPPTTHVVELVNALCRSYSTARWLLLRATTEAELESDHVISLPGLPQVKTGLRSGLLLAATGSFYAVLGQAAYALDSYMRLKHNRRRLTFDTVWGLPGCKGFPSDKTDIHPRIRSQQMPPLTAFYSLSLSFQHGLGRYSHLRTLRNQLEHHVVLTTDSPLESRYFVTVSLQQLQEAAFSLGRLARAAVWYLSASFLGFEQRRARASAARGETIVPTPGTYVTRH